MSSAAVMWTSSPSALGRPSSPLNPHANHAGPSSSPMTSPTPPQQRQFPAQFTLGAAPPMRHRPAPTLQTRYNRPSSRRSSSFPLQTPPHPSGGDPFGEGKGATPVESAMWKERFTRRVKDRERRKRARDEDIDRRRSMDRSDEVLDEEEADRRAQADDEEIFRRLMILQRRKAEHAAMVSYEVETGGSDPALPDFWDEELEALAQEERRLSSRLDQPFAAYAGFDADDADEMMATPKRGATFRDARPSPMQILDEEDEWELEAAAAEEAEREAEDAEIARRVEEAYGLSVPVNSGGDLDMDMDAFDAMDIE